MLRTKSSVRAISFPLSIASALAEILNEYGKSKEAAKYLQACQAALQESHDGKSPEQLRIHCQLAGCYAFDGQYQAALALYRQTLEEQRTQLSDKHLDTLKTEYGFALALITAGDFQQAETHLLNLIEAAKNGDLKHHPIVQFAESKLATLECVLGRASSLDRHKPLEKMLEGSMVAIPKLVCSWMLLTQNHSCYLEDRQKRKRS